MKVKHSLTDALRATTSRTCNMINQCNSATFFCGQQETLSQPSCPSCFRVTRSKECVKGSVHVFECFCVSHLNGVFIVVFTSFASMEVQSGKNQEPATADLTGFGDSRRTHHKEQEAKP